MGRESKGYSLKVECDSYVIVVGVRFPLALGTLVILTFFCYPDPMWFHRPCSPPCPLVPWPRLSASTPPRRGGDQYPPVGGCWSLYEYPPRRGGDQYPPCRGGAGVVPPPYGGGGEGGGVP